MSQDKYSKNCVWCTVAIHPEGYTFYIFDSYSYTKSGDIRFQQIGVNVVKTESHNSRSITPNANENPIYKTE